MEEIHVVCPDVFLEDNPGMPPYREIELSIYLVLGTSPISKAQQS